MSMPLRLTFIRHGESEHNWINAMLKKGDDSLVTDEFYERHNSQHRLSAAGRQHAISAGKWLKEHDMDMFDRRYVSDYVRAKETAALLDLSGPDWMVDHVLREREWGDWDSYSKDERKLMRQRSIIEKDTDPFYWIPPNGESIAQLTSRLDRVLGSLHRECSDKRVLIVCHGEVMWAFRQMIERISMDEWRALDESDDPFNKINNCQILDYSRRDPVTGELSNYLDWSRSICPWDETLSSNEWKKIERKRLTNEDLMKSVNNVPHLFNT